MGNRNLLLIPFAPKPLLSGHGGPKDKSSHGQFERYYRAIYEAQYQALGKPHAFRYHIHVGGHATHAPTVIAFFEELFCPARRAGLSRPTRLLGSPKFPVASPCEAHASPHVGDRSRLVFSTDRQLPRPHRVSGANVDLVPSGVTSRGDSRRPWPAGCRSKSGRQTGLVVVLDTIFHLSMGAAEWFVERRRWCDRLLGIV